MRRIRLPISIAAVLAACSSPDSSDPPPESPVAGATARFAWIDAPELADGGGPVPQIMIETATGRPRFVVGRFATPPNLGFDGAARAVLERHRVRLDVDPANLRLTAVRRGIAGRYVRFARLAGGLRVIGADVVVRVDGSAVTAINLGEAAPARALAGPDIGADRGLAIARAHVAATGALVVAPVVERAVLADARVAYRVELAVATADWEVIVDAATGAVVSSRDRRLTIDGSGLVFDPTAVDSTGNVNLLDNNDMTSAALDAARFTVVLEDLDGTGILRGPFADARNLSSRATSPTHVFDFDRQQDEFEEVMAYFHLDRAQRRIQALGFTDVNNRVQVAIVNAFSADNSFYSPSTKRVEFGTGGVDDAEDGDIILHEYGHSIHDNQVPGWGGGDEGAMGEAFGDYLAASFGDVLPAAAGHPNMIDNPCVGSWDATSYDTGNPPCLRRTDGDKHFPEDEVNQVHADGEMWSAALWRARTTTGADAMDTLVMEHHFLLSTNESFETASAALLVTAQTLFAGAHHVTVRRALHHRGVYRVPLTPEALPDVAGSLTVSVDNPRPGGQYDNNVDDTQSVTFPGATAVRIHFELFETQASNDFVYLFDADGDLYQIIHGDHDNTVSVVIPGDTIQIRLVSNATQRRFGYHVDRIDSMFDDGMLPPDAAPDAPPPPDAAPDAPPPPDAAPDAPPPPDAAPDAPPPPDAPPVPPPDAGPPSDARPPDAAPSTPDAEEEDDEEDGGCCNGSPGGSAPWVIVVLLALLRRRPLPG